MIAPILDDIANEYVGKIKVAKINIDDNPNTPAKFGVRGIPTLMIFKSGSIELQKWVPYQNHNYQPSLTQQFKIYANF